MRVNQVPAAFVDARRGNRAGCLYDAGEMLGVGRIDDADAKRHVVLRPPKLAVSPAAFTKAPRIPLRRNTSSDRWAAQPFTYPVGSTRREWTTGRTSRR